MAICLTKDKQQRENAKKVMKIAVMKILIHLVMKDVDQTQVQKIIVDIVQTYTMRMDMNVPQLVMVIIIVI